MSFTIILSHSVGCLFVLFMVSSAVQKLLSLIRFICPICLFLFLFPLFGSQIGKDVKIYVGECSAYVFL